MRFVYCRLLQRHIFRRSSTKLLAQTQRVQCSAGGCLFLYESSSGIQRYSRCPYFSPSSELLEYELTATAELAQPLTLLGNWQRIICKSSYQLNLRQNAQASGGREVPPIVRSGLIIWLQAFWERYVLTPCFQHFASLRGDKMEEQTLSSLPAGARNHITLHDH